LTNIYLCSTIFYILYTLVDSKHASIFEISIFSDRKMNLVGTFGRSKLKIPRSFRKRREKLPTNYEKPLRSVILISNDMFITITTNKK